MNTTTFQEELRYFTSRLQAYRKFQQQAMTHLQHYLPEPILVIQYSRRVGVIFS
jgi:hypothetical protein